MTADGVMAGAATGAEAAPATGSQGDPPGRRPSTPAKAFSRFRDVVVEPSPGLGRRGALTAVGGGRARPQRRMRALLAVAVSGAELEGGDPAAAMEVLALRGIGGGVVSGGAEPPDRPLRPRLEAGVRLRGGSKRMARPRRGLAERTAAGVGLGGARRQGGEPRGPTGCSGSGGWRRRGGCVPRQRSPSTAPRGGPPRGRLRSAAGDSTTVW